MRPFNLQEYFKDLGNGWRINTVTGSIFFKNKEIIINKASAREVLANFLEKKKGFKIHPFLKRNFLEVGFVRDSKHIGVWAGAMYSVLEKILNRRGFTIEVTGGLCSQKAEWRLCYVNQ